jgi:hypothetical protein
MTNICEFIFGVVCRLGAVHDGSPPPSYLGGPGAVKCRSVIDQLLLNNLNSFFLKREDIGHDDAEFPETKFIYRMPK